MKPADRALRFEAVRLMGCLCCRMNRRLSYSLTGMHVEIHHQNAGGHAGQKRLGDEYTVPLCMWHHRGVTYAGSSKAQMTRLYGPTWAGGSKPFRATYGTDAEHLDQVDAKLRAANLTGIYREEAA